MAHFIFSKENGLNLLIKTGAKLVIIEIAKIGG